jgi:hypothetical protein
MRTDQEKKINTLKFMVSEMLNEIEYYGNNHSNPHLRNDQKEVAIAHIGGILCIFDTDIAIEVLKCFEDVGETKEVIRGIKVNYGY